MSSLAPSPHSHPWRRPAPPHEQPELARSLDAVSRRRRRASQRAVEAEYKRLTQRAVSEQEAERLRRSKLVLRFADDVTPTALGCLSRDNALRRVCIAVQRSVWFERAVLLAICANIVLLAMVDPEASCACSVTRRAASVLMPAGARVRCRRMWIARHPVRARWSWATWSSTPCFHWRLQSSAWQWARCAAGPPSCVIPGTASTSSLSSVGACGCSAHRMRVCACARLSLAPTLPLLLRGAQLAAVRDATLAARVHGERVGAARCARVQGAAHAE